MDRWLARATGWLMVIVGGVALYIAMEGNPATGAALAVGTLGVSVGVTLVHEDIRRHRGGRRSNG